MYMYIGWLVGFVPQKESKCNCFSFTCLCVNFKASQKHNCRHCRDVVVSIIGNLAMIIVDNMGFMAKEILSLCCSFDMYVDKLFWKLGSSF